MASTINQVSNFLKNQLEDYETQAIAQIETQTEELRHKVSSDRFKQYMNRCRLYGNYSPTDLKQELLVLQQLLNVVNSMIEFGNKVYDPRETEKIVYELIADFIANNSYGAPVEKPRGIAGVFDDKDTQDSLTELENESTSSIINSNPFATSSSSSARFLRSSAMESDDLPEVPSYVPHQSRKRQRTTQVQLDQFYEHEDEAVVEPDTLQDKSA